ncbi:Hed1p KNAG_0H01420 [Huiozyma naganishii CBS 8797]|uniref:Uncharacterized protein n=1 Tax=Huiozyma naganishii (strain ATCC MYA-139 / BCRC 22969 / CBS 8797 / KCTC 17520 / NBRC 10181 / NCYC 3082 / Yp74L-3) TaxID=1071383 RepID=J7R9M2_HUIN7|nr:hypothetical protein KNAG_0H01420 [Kazachstania naganishii CBS 8797]CCK71555.1 hypothetical protein KNAG_0H01420 [Kazachstania naganishii CBS 8797]
MRRSRTMAVTVPVRRYSRRAVTSVPVELEKINFKLGSLDLLDLASAAGENSAPYQTQYGGGESDVHGSVDTTISECDEEVSKEIDSSNGIGATAADAESPCVTGRESPYLSQEEDSPQTSSPDTSGTAYVTTALPREVHKSLKELIYKTNRELYDVDSNKVQYKAGLSRESGHHIPSLHTKRVEVKQEQSSRG